MRTIRRITGLSICRTLRSAGTGLCGVRSNDSFDLSYLQNHKTNTARSTSQKPTPTPKYIRIASLSLSPAVISGPMAS